MIVKKYLLYALLYITFTGLATNNEELNALLAKHCIKVTDVPLSEQVNHTLSSKQKEIDELQARKKAIHGFIGFRAVVLGFACIPLWACRHKDERMFLLCIQGFFAGRIAQGAYHLRKTNADIQKVSDDVKSLTNLQTILIENKMQIKV